MIIQLFSIRLHRHLLLYLLICLLPCLTTYSQQRTISGKVIDAQSNQPLSGVTVGIKGTNKGTSTSADGSFQLTGGPSATLVVSYVGYQTKEVPFNNSSPITVMLEAGSAKLNEVVVVSYGTQRKREVTGAISQLNEKEVKDMPAANIGQRLQGKLAGVQINQNTGQPGAEMAFRIRGAASINAGNSPLIVVDGFPIESGLNSISPDAIESISVLKDAAASSLYGSRAANGVILVTTKQARAGQKNIEFDSYVGVQSVSKRGRPDLMNAPEFARFKKEYYEDAALYEGYTGGVPVQYQNPSQYSPNDGTNWFDVLLRKALTQNYNLNLSSGTKDIRSVVNLGFNKQDGVMINQSASRFTARSNNIYNATDKLTLDLNLGVTYQTSNITPGLGNGRNIIQTAFLTDPTLNYKNLDGTYPIGFAPPGMFSTPNYYQVLMKTVNPKGSDTDRKCIWCL